MIITVKTNAKTEFIDITTQINSVLKSEQKSEKITQKGLCFLFVPHTTAAITINESADPSVKNDILKILNSTIPWQADYSHLEGNSPAHIKSTIVGVSQTVAVENSRLILGTWQVVFFCEFDGPRTRKVHVHFINK